MPSARATVSLVALCFVAVLGIVLGSYIAICSRAMNLSNRSYQAGLSQQLTEFGLEEGLRAFNRNDWSGWASNPSGMSGGTTAWTLDTTNKRASRTITLDATKLGQGATATVKIRIDNYDANYLDAVWSSTTTYRVNDLVGYNGIWYRCVQNHSPSQTPANISNLSYWVPMPIGPNWLANHDYAIGDMIFQGPYWRRCTTAHTSGATFTAGNWTTIPNLYGDVNGSTYYYFNDIAYYPGNQTWYICTAGGWGAGASYTTAPISWRFDSGSKSYAMGDLVYYSGAWYRCILSHTSSGARVPGTGGGSSYWTNALTSMWGWNSTGINYNIGDIVYYNTTTQWYRCIQAHSASSTRTPGSAGGAAYWSNAPLYSPEWDAGKQYSQNDTVYYNGTWYLSLANSNVAQNPATATASWIGADTTNASYQWNATTAYAGNAYRCYGGAWYKCLVANTGQNPNNTTYWTPTWTNSYGVTTGASIIYAEASVALANSPALWTQIRAVINPAPLFPNAAGATGDLTITTGTGTVDSYDSTAGAYGGANVGYSAVLASGATLAINGTTTVKGYLAWPTPASGISSNTTVWSSTSPSMPKVDPTRVSRSPYIPQFDILPASGLASSFSSVPKGVALPTPTVSSVSIGIPGAATPARYYYTGNLTIGGGAVIQTLNIDGPVILYISGDLVMTSTGGGTSNVGIININGTGSAEIHVGGGLKVDSGSDGIVNKTLDPKALTILCDSSGTTNQFYNEGANAFYGTIYVPKTTATNGFSFNYGDTNATTQYGAVSASKITYTNSANLHYDTSLRYAVTPGVDQPYAVTEWRELPVTEQATMP